MGDLNTSIPTPDLQPTKGRMSISTMPNQSSDKTASSGSVVNIQVPPQSAVTLTINIQADTVSKSNERVDGTGMPSTESSVNTAKRESTILGGMPRPTPNYPRQSTYNGHRLHIVREAALDWGRRISIIVSTLTGKSMAFSFHTALKVFRLKEAIQNVEGIPPDQQKLSFEGKLLENEKDFYSV